MERDVTTKHTPGPWTPKIRSGLSKATKNETVADIEAAGPYRGDIARLQSAEHINGIAADEMVANARLIAAAPDLLEALAECEDYFDNRADADCDQDGFIPNKEMMMLRLVRAAIAKAEGQS